MSSDLEPDEEYGDAQTAKRRYLVERMCSRDFNDTEERPEPGTLFIEREDPDPAKTWKKQPPKFTVCFQDWGSGYTEISTHASLSAAKRMHQLLSKKFETGIHLDTFSIGGIAQEMHIFVTRLHDRATLPRKGKK